MDSYIYETGAQPKVCIIWMHGLGADGQDMINLAKGLALNTNIRHISLNAKVRPVTVNNSFPMRAWYDIKGNNLTDREDSDGILASEKKIVEAVAEEKKNGFLPERIFLAGFSQGGAMALFTGLHAKLNFKGIISLSSYLPLVTHLDDIQYKNIPIFMASGQFDTIVLPKWSHMTAQWLKKSQVDDITFKEYPIAHAVSIEEMQDISQWLNKQITTIDAEINE